MVLALMSSTCCAQLNKLKVIECLKSTSKTLVTAELSVLEKVSDNSETRAYKGALMMKAAQFLEKPALRLEKFKAGKTLLEKEIKDQPKNVEFRFLRLMIQENAPTFLKYHSNINEDAVLIQDGYEKQSNSIKTAISNYSKISKQLKELD